MTKFTKEGFNYHGGYVTYQGRFVARFKYGAVSSARPFMTFLIKNYTVEEYFALRETPNPDNCLGNVYAPLEIVEQKGFILSHIKKWLKEGTLKTWKGQTAAQLGLI
jgi:hypothetical protein